MYWRSLWLAALLGLLRTVCAAQDPVPLPKPPAPPPQSSTEDSGTKQSPPAQNQTPPAQSQTSPGQGQTNPAPPPQDSSSKTPDEPPQEPGEKPPSDKSSSSKTQPKPAAPQISQNQALIQLDSSETIFTVLTALNACGYDQDLTISDTVRSTVRNELQRNLLESAPAEAARTEVCQFVQNHVAARDPNRNLSQYISFALYVDGPPHFVPRVREEDLPPDAYNVAQFGPVLERFYGAANVHAIWEHHRADYAAVMRRYHDPLQKMVFDTQVYLKQSSQYLGRKFTIYLDFMGSPNETDARNYGLDYYIVVFPAPNRPNGDTPATALKIDEIRHTFLHYELDPLAEKHFTAMKRLEPLLQSVKRAPLEESFKSDISLLVTECLVRAIEIRTSGGKQPADEALRQQAVEDAVKQGYILTRYFYNTAVAFEKDAVSIRGVYGDFLENIDVKKEERAAADVQFASAASPELVRLSRPEGGKILLAAEKRLAAGDPKGAQELAQEAIDKKLGDQGRALFILAEIAVMSKNRDGAEENFQKAIAASSDPIVLGWSHVYLGRILDMKEDRDAAVKEYHAALDSSGRLPDIRAAAEHGIAQAYEPPSKPQ